LGSAAFVLSVFDYQQTKKIATSLQGAKNWQITVELSQPANITEVNDRMLKIAGKTNVSFSCNGPEANASFRSQP
jgi:ssRNA-specific RNase YbeY (16S rRNA maturation enzyme)